MYSYSAVPWKKWPSFGRAWAANIDARSISLMTGSILNNDDPLLSSTEWNVMRWSLV